MWGDVGWASDARSSVITGHSGNPPITSPTIIGRARQRAHPTPGGKARPLFLRQAITRRAKAMYEQVIDPVMPVFCPSSQRDLTQRSVVAL